MTGKRSQPSPVGSPSSDSSSKDQDRFLPIANVGRIMKKSLPTNAKISKESKETVQECVSEFISFITGEASEKCQREKRKTINGDDLLWAMTTLGFENYVGTLKVYLNKYRETEGEKNTMGIQEDQAISSIEHKAHNGASEISNNGNNNNEFANSFVVQGRVSGYEEDQMMSKGFNMYEHGNSTRPMATHLHHGVECVGNAYVYHAMMCLKQGRSYYCHCNK